ncbi:glyoxalase/bleomycin resistance/dioxygenase family protein [Sesbania bispinosa]|nr:glyoxalase/bleomycin resistance/dioxygenase family protein [Sesbania bispinosa]
MSLQLLRVISAIGSSAVCDFGAACDNALWLSYVSVRDLSSCSRELRDRGSASRRSCVSS